LIGKQSICKVTNYTDLNLYFQNFNPLMGNEFLEFGAVTAISRVEPYCL